MFELGSHYARRKGLNGQFLADYPSEMPKQRHHSGCSYLEQNGWLLVDIVVPKDAKLPHFRLQGRPFQSQLGSCSARAGHNTAALPQYANDVLTLRRMQSVINTRGFVLGLQFGKRY